MLLAGHAERIVRMAFSADGTALASGGDDKVVMVWNVVSGDRRPFAGHAARVNALAFSGDGTTLWSGGDDGAIFEWDLTRSNTLVRRASPTANEPELPFDSTDMVISPDGRRVAFPFADEESGRMAIREVATGRLRTFPFWSTSVSFSPDGQKILTVMGYEYGTLRISDADSGAVLAESEPDGRMFAGAPPGPKAVFTPDGSHVVAIQIDVDDPENAVGSVVVLDANTLATTGGAPVPIPSVARALDVTPDGNHAIVVVSEPYAPDTQVLLIDLATRRVLRSTPVELLGESFPGPRNNSFAADGRTVGIGNPTGDLGIVDAVNGKVTTRSRVHSDTIESVAFAPDAATFVTTSEDGAVYLWDTATQAQLGAMTPSGANRVRASFLADDRVMLVYGTGEIFEWDPRPDTWEAYACRVAGRNLRQSERDELFPGQAYRITCPQYPAGD